MTHTRLGAIVEKANSSLNLCLFYAMYNALSSIEEKKAFSGGRVIPHELFLEVIAQCPFKHKDAPTSIDIASL